MSTKDEVVTKGYLDKRLDEAMKAQTDEIVGVIQSFMVTVDERFNKLEAKVDNLQNDMNSVMNRLDSIEKDISLNDDERQVMGMQLSRLHDWVEKAALKVGVEFVH